jgi:hypothetical protein
MLFRKNKVSRESYKTKKSTVHTECRHLSVEISVCVCVCVYGNHNVLNV